jgi:phage recombination protein Bet
MNAVAQFQPPRLPYHPALQERFGVDASGWKALVEAVYPLAKTPDSVAMALSYCKARKLDPFKKPVHIVPMWDSKIGGYVETIWPGISEVRTTAFRTGQYAGCDEAEFGPMMSKSFTGKVKRKEGYVEQSVEVEFPEWCRMTVYRVLGDRVCKFVGPKVKWLESYATIGNTDLPNDMWQSRPEGQIEKCAEAAALRKAFPEELGNELTAEEMAGRRVEGDLGIEAQAEPARRQPPAPPKIEDAVVTEVKPSGRAPKPPHDTDTGEVEQEKPAETKPEPTKVTSGSAAPAEQQDTAKASRKPRGWPKLFEHARIVIEDGVFTKDVDGFATIGEAAQEGDMADADLILKDNVIIKNEVVVPGAEAAAPAAAAAADPAAAMAKFERDFDAADSIDALNAAAQANEEAYRKLKAAGLHEPADALFRKAEARILAADRAAAEAERMQDDQQQDEKAGAATAADDDTFPGDRPSANAAPVKPEKMSPSEFEAHTRAYIANATDPEALKKRWYMDDDLREKLGEKVRAELRALWKARMDELRAAEGQG